MVIIRASFNFFLTICLCATASDAESKNTRDSYQAMAKEMQSAEDEKSSKIKTLERTSK